MDSLDYDKLFSLIGEDKIGEAKQFLDEALQGDLSPEEKGEIYAHIASVYWQMMSKVNEGYAAELELGNKELKEMAKDEQKLADEVDLNLARNQLD